MQCLIRCCATLLLVLAFPFLTLADIKVGKLLDESVEIGTTSTLLLEYRHDNYDAGVTENDRLVNLLGRINLRVGWKWFRASVRLDGLQFLYRSTLCRNRNDNSPDKANLPICRVRLQKDYRVGQFQVTYRSRMLTLSGGFVTEQFGRGLVLSLRKVDEVGIDLSLLGGRGQLRLGDHTLTVLGGAVSHTEVDFASLEFIDDPFDVVTGIRYEVLLANTVTLGAHYVFSHLMKTADQGGFARYHLPGLSLQVPELGKHLSLEVEGALLWRDASSLEQGLGYAMFASLNGSFGPVSSLLEFKYYRNFRFGGDVSPRLLYHEPPSLERLDQQVPNNNNVFGGRFRLSAQLWGGKSVPFLNVLLYTLNMNTQQDPMTGDATRLAYHVYVGLEQKIGITHLKLSFGTRRDFFVYREDSPLTPRLYRLVWRTDGSFSVPLGRHSIEAKWEHRWETRQAFQTLNFIKGRGTLTYGFSPWLTIAFLVSWDTSKAESIQPHVLIGGEIQGKFGRWGQIKIFGGGLHGGLVCVSGSCRNLPTFTGVRTEFVLRI